MKPIEELVLPSQDEIVEQINKRAAGDPFGWEVRELINYLDYEHAKPFLKPEATREEWEKIRFTLTREHVFENMRQYYPFAWQKANDCRGLSAQRSILHFFGWIFLLGDKEFFDEITDHATACYSFYGKPILERIGERYGWEWKTLDNGKRVNTDGE